MKNAPEAYPLSDITFQWVNFHQTNIWKWGLWNVLDSINDGSNIWIDVDGKPLREWVMIYNKELLPGILVVAFENEQTRRIQLQANENLSEADAWKYTIPDVSTFFEVEKDGKKLYCYVVDRMDILKHKKEMLVGELDSISIDGIIVYPTGLLLTDEVWEKTKGRVDNLVPKL